MRLAEDEALPTLRRSHFLSLPREHTPTTPKAADSPSGPGARELSLCEWSLWQNHAQPTHAVDHSTRCQHFVGVMELIDRLREENSDEECSYEKELLPHLHKADVVAGLLVDGGADKPAKRPTKKKTTKTGKSKSASRASSEAERTAEESERDSRGGVKSCLPSATARLMSPAANDPDFVDFNGEEMKESRDPGTTRETSGDAEPEDGIGSENCPSPLEGPVGDPLPTAGDCDNDPGLEEDIEIQAMFYLPKGVPAGSSSHKRLPELHPSESLRVILANVAELLSRSPPQLPFDFDMEEDMLDAGSPDTPNATSLP
ncbi:hypothetical protein CRUP_003198, partial [Coryphaenoides rupestris]